MHNSGLRLLYKFLLCIVVGTMLYGMHILSEILTIETDEGFQYQVELYLKQKQRGTFKQRFFIGCGLPERNGFINMVTRQGTLRLKIPVGDGVSEIYRLNDMKDECSPDQFRVRLFWYQGQLVNAKEFNRLKELPGAPQGNPNYRTVYLSFINLDQTEEQYREFVFRKTKHNEAHRYQPSYQHHYLPLDFLPNYYKGDRDIYDIPYAIHGSRSLRTGLPVRVSCNLKAGRMNEPFVLEKALSADIIPQNEWIGAKCLGSDAVIKNNHALVFSFEASSDTTPELDKLHQAMLAKVTSYIQN